jgi:hypothetical protein
MSTPHEAFEHAQERHEHLLRGHDRLVPLVTAVIAVLAALGTLFAHHRSITALVVKNDSILATANATDQYNYYQSRRLRASIYSAIVSADLVKDRAVREALGRKAADEERASLAALAKAQGLQKEALAQSDRSEELLKSFETLEIAVTLFEIGIVFASISALTDSRFLLWGGAIMSGIGIAFTVYGYFQGH